MPRVLHEKLAKQARKQGLTGERAKAYIYGTLNRLEKGEGSKRTYSIADKLRGKK
jgi:hypothetical protein